MRNIQTYESFKPKKIEGRAKELQKLKEKKIAPYINMLKTMLAELELPYESLDEVYNQHDRLYLDLNKKNIGKTNYYEILIVSIKDASNKVMKKTRMNITKMTKRIGGYGGQTEINLATFEFLEDGSVYRRNING